jgi:ubiquinone/menaquinone biosynthesis C-methylase UbiE
MDVDAALAVPPPVPESLEDFPVNDVEFEQAIGNPAARTSRYREVVPAYFTRVTETYREKWSDSFHFAIFKGSESLDEALLATEKWIAEQAGFAAGQHILDVGCGIGGPALNIAGHSGARVTGINITPVQVEIARQRAADRGLAGRTCFVQGDAMKLPFADRSFDHVYVFDAGCHMPDKPGFYVECGRILRPGGTFTGLDWMKKDNLTPAEESRWIEPICRLHSVPHLISLPELGRCLTDAGLQIEALEDASRHGNILRNWEMVDTLAVRGIRGLLPWLIPPTLRMLTDGGLALAKAARHGAFIIGYWRARK